MKIEKAVERVFDRANLIGENADVYGLMMNYKCFRDMGMDALDEIYDEIVERLGFVR